MKNAFILAIGLFIFGACSAAQKQAELKLAENSSECAISCAFEKALENIPADQAAKECGVQCGVDLVTNPDNQRSFMRLLAGAKAGAMAYGASVKADAGK